MNPQHEGILQLVKSALTGKACSLPINFSLQEAFPIVCHHGIEAMVYYGAVYCGFSKSVPGMDKLYQGCVRRILLWERQQQQIEKLLQTFRENAIDVLPLKGVLLRDLYPKPEMRRMGDADILIRQTQYPRIKPILESLGYTRAGETDHEIAWHHPCLRLELHILLVPERNKLLYHYFGDGWKRAYLKSDHLYVMSPEDTLVFLVAHVAKHYTAGGIGIQQFVDLWLYTQTNPQIDQKYLQQELKKIHLNKFYFHVMNMLQMWFAQKQWDSLGVQMTEFVLASGCYGTGRNAAIAQGAKHKNIAQRLWASAFPGYGEMKLRYPILGRWPILLPATWIIRAGNILLLHRNRVPRKVRNLQIATEDTIRTLRQHFDDIGLRSNL